VRAFNAASSRSRSSVTRLWSTWTGLRTDIATTSLAGEADRGLTASGEV
jgi:hypothetical protein